MNRPDFTGSADWADLVAAGRVTRARPEVLDATRAAVAQAVLRDADAPHGARSTTAPRHSAIRRSVSRRSGYRIALTGAVAATAAAVVLTAMPGRPPATTPTAPAGPRDAGTFLAQLADAQVAKPTPDPDSAYWRITRTRTNADGTRVTIRSKLAHRAGTSLLGDKSVRGPWRYLIGTRSLTWDQLAKLPTTPTGLRASLRTYADPGQDEAEGIYSVIGDLLVSPAPPKVRAALYEVAASLPGVRLAGRVKDLDGRSGTAVERDDGTVTTRYVVDSTGRLLETVYITDHALPALRANPSPDDIRDPVTVWEGRNLNGSRPALRAGAVVERDTFTDVGPAN